jgi:hypothetical protein
MLYIPMDVIDAMNVRSVYLTVHLGTQDVFVPLAKKRLHDNYCSGHHEMINRAMTTLQALTIRTGAGSKLTYEKEKKEAKRKPKRKVVVARRNYYYPVWLCRTRAMSR